MSSARSAGRPSRSPSAALASARPSTSCSRPAVPLPPCSRETALLPSGLKAFRPDGPQMTAETPPLDQRDGPRDECGVFGVYAPEHDVSRLAYFALYALQHRGQESAGIAATDRGGHILTQRDLGLVSQVFNEQSLRALVGDMAIGHVRYSTTGSNAWENTQPVWRSDRHEIALAHNGNLTNAVELHSELRDRGTAFSSTSDSEIIAALIA